MKWDLFLVIKLLIVIACELVSAVEVTEDTAKILPEDSNDEHWTSKIYLTRGKVEKSSGSHPVNLARNDTDKNSSVLTDCTRHVAHCQRCRVRENLTTDQTDVFLDEDTLEKMELELDEQGDDRDDEYLQNRLNITQWECLECQWKYTLSHVQTQCVPCRSEIPDCTDCYNEDGQIQCTVCDEEFYVDNKTSCTACSKTIKNCNTCEYDVTNPSNSLFCTGCKGGFYFDYYRNCSSCNETLPKCTHCSSFEACKVFGSVQNLTCHRCEDGYYVGKDEISCKVDCRNISDLCDNCFNLAGKEECLACTTESYLDQEGICHTCTEKHPNCRECTDVSSDVGTRCLSCNAGFVLHPGTSACKDCSVIPQCSNCLLSNETEDGEESTVCIQCDLGYTLSNTKKGCIDCSSAEDHCGNCHQDSDDVLRCIACVPGFDLIREKCKVIVCGLPPPPPHRGGYGFTGMAYGHTVTYDCECGFDLIGQQILTCDEFGQWGEAPCCKKNMLGVSVDNLYYREKSINDDDIIEILHNMKDINVAELDFTDNKLSEVPCLSHFKQLDTLQSIQLSNNRIEKFVWDDFPAETRSIDLRFNELRTLPEGANCHKCLNVVNIYFDRNYLSTIKTDNIPHTVVRLSLADNNIFQVDSLSHCKYLIQLDLVNNNIVTVPQKLPKSLQELRLLNNKLSMLSDMTYLDQLIILDLRSNKLTSIVPDHLPRRLKILMLGSNKISVINDLSCLKEIQYLTLGNNNITKFPDHLPLDLVELNLNHNGISKFENITYLAKLYYLDISNNNISSISEHVPQTLEYLNVQNNNADITTVRYLYKLQTLHMDNCSLYNFSPRQLPTGVIRREFGSCEIKHNILKMDNLTELWSLDIDIDTLRLWPLEMLVNLTYLGIHGKRDLEREMDLSHLTNIKIVSLWNFFLFYMPSNLPPNIKYLHAINSVVADSSTGSHYKNLRQYCELLI